MPKMTVVVDKLPYGKTAYRKGAEVEVEDRHVELFLRAGKARWPEGASPNPSDLPDEVMSRASKREPITEVEEPVEEVAEVDEETMATKVLKAEAVEEDEAPKSVWEPGGIYHRRDLVAETPKTELVPNEAIPYPKKRGRPFGKKSQS